MASGSELLAADDEVVQRLLRLGRRLRDEDASSGRYGIASDSEVELLQLLGRKCLVGEVSPVFRRLPRCFGGSSGWSSASAVRVCFSASLSSGPLRICRGAARGVVRADPSPDKTQSFKSGPLRIRHGWPQGITRADPPLNKTRSFREPLLTTTRTRTTTWARTTIWARRVVAFWKQSCGTSAG